MHELVQVLAELEAAVPNPGPVVPPGMEKPAEMLLGWMKWIGILAGMVGLGMCALMMIIGRRNRSSLAVDGAAGIPWVLAGLSLITLSSGLVAAVLG
jgi:hypothetical protein